MLYVVYEKIAGRFYPMDMEAEKPVKCLIYASVFDLSPKEAHEFKEELNTLNNGREFDVRKKSK